MNAAVETETGRPVIDVASVARNVAKTVQPRYAAYLSLDDVNQQLWLRAATDNNIRREAERGEYQSVYLKLHAAATRHCESEKAARVGYRLEDVAWYSAESVERLLPLALDPLFNGTARFDEEPEGKRSRQSGDQANLLVQVIDVRRAVARVGANVDAIVRFLGGDGPQSGRRAMSNAQAVAVTQEQT